MSISGITTTNNNGIERITNDQQITGTGTADGETLVLDGSSSYLETGTSSGTISLSDCAIVIDSDTPTGNDSTAVMNYGGRTVTATTLELDHCHIIINTLSTRHNMQFTDLRNVKIIEEGSSEMFVYTRGGGDVTNVLFRNINVWEVYGNPDNLANITIDGLDYAYLNWEAGRLDFFNLAVSNIGLAHVWAGTGNSGNNYCYHWNNDSSFNNQLMYLTSANNEYHEGYTACWKFIDQLTLNPVEDVVVILKDDLSGSLTTLGTYTTNSNGRLSGTWDSQNRSTGSSQERPVLFMQTLWTENVDTGNPGSYSYPTSTIGGDQGNRSYNYDLVSIENQIEVRSYLHLAPVGFILGDVFSPTVEIGKRDVDGSVLTYQDFVLIPDPGIVATKTVADAYTTIDDLDELFDRTKSEWVDNNGYPLPEFNNSIIDLGSANLVVNTGAASTWAYSGGTITIDPTTVLDISSTKTSIATSGSITFSTASIGDDLILNGNVYLNAEQDLNGVSITGDLHINTGANSVLSFSDVVVNGNVYNDTSSYTLQINSTGSSSLSAGDPGTGVGLTNIIQTAPIKVTVKDIESGSVIQGARVFIEADSGGDLPASESVSINRSGTTATVSHSSHGMVDNEYIIIKGANQTEYNGEHQITYINTNSYSYSVSGSPATPATGTITATARIVNDTTDASGEVNKTFRYTNPQPVIGKVRKATL